MFTAIGVGVQRGKNPSGYDATVDYFDDRVNPKVKVMSVVHQAVKNGAALTTLVNQQLVQLKNSDELGDFNAAVAGKVLGTI